VALRWLRRRLPTNDIEKRSSDGSPDDLKMLAGEPADARVRDLHDGRVEASGRRT
jgi:hypothetical protein